MMVVTFEDDGVFDDGDEDFDDGYDDFDGEYDDDDDGDFEGDGNDDSTNQVYNLSKLTDWRTAYGIGKYTEITLHIH